MKKRQVYGIPTYDALFKWVLSKDSVRPSFFHAFIPGLVIKSSERLDDHMNPLQELQLLRNAIHDGEITKLVASLKDKQPKVEVHVDNSYHDKATDLLKTLLLHFDDIQYSFPRPRFDGKMDFVCRLDTGEYALVEMQIMPEDQWDQRALAYVGAFYGNQLRKSDSWKSIQKVIGVNILGGGKDNLKHWQETPEQYVRHFKFQEQIHKEDPPRYLHGIEIIQYALANVPENVDTQEQKDWLRFFKDAHNMTEEDVEREIKTPAVREAFERAKLVDLPVTVREKYRAEEDMFDNLSGLMAERETKGREEERAKAEVEKKRIAQTLLKQGVEMSIVRNATGLSEKEILS